MYIQDTDFRLLPILYEMPAKLYGDLYEKKNDPKWPHPNNEQRFSKTYKKFNEIVEESNFFFNLK